MRSNRATGAAAGRFGPRRPAEVSLPVAEKKKNQPVSFSGTMQTRCAAAPEIKLRFVQCAANYREKRDLCKEQLVTR